MWNCKIDGGDTKVAGYPELHIGKCAEDCILQVLGDIRAIGDDTLRIIGEGIQFIPGRSRSCIQILDEGEPIPFLWVGVLLDNTMNVCERVILQTTFPNNGPVVTMTANQGGDSVTIEIVGGEARYQMVDYDVLDIVVDRRVQELRKLG